MGFLRSVRRRLMIVLCACGAVLLGAAEQPHRSFFEIETATWTTLLVSPATSTPM